MRKTLLLMLVLMLSLLTAGCFGGKSRSDLPSEGYDANGRHWIRCTPPHRVRGDCVPGMMNYKTGVCGAYEYYTAGDTGCPPSGKLYVN